MRRQIVTAMAEIAWAYLNRSAVAGNPWPEITAQLRAQASRRGLVLRDCIVLVPFVQLLAAARLEFAKRGGWMPRVETSHTLAKTLGSEPVCLAGEPSFDLAIDSLVMQQLLLRQAWGRDWMARDPAGLMRAAAQVARTTHDLARSAFTLEPSLRPAHWRRVRDILAPIEGPGAIERRLAMVAAEWAMLAPAPATDRLFELRPAAWFAVSAGGVDPFTMNLLNAAAAEVCCAVLDTDRTGPMDCGGRPPNHDPNIAECDDFESEAQCAAAQILEHVRCLELPIALIAQDRVLVRRVRALLERSSVSIADETGWKLSTTRAAARVLTLLRAALPGASADSVLDWLKTGTHWLGLHDSNRAIQSLESHCRHRKISRLSSLGISTLDEPAQMLNRCAFATLEKLAASRPKPLKMWMASLAAALTDCGVLDALAEDEAGRQTLGALRLGVPPAAAQVDLALAGNEPVRLTHFIAWVETALEANIFRPAPDLSAPAQVLITPLAQAMLRPFAAVVAPGADETHLGAPAAPHPLLSEAQAAALGLGTAEQHRQGQRLALDQLLDCRRVTFLRRRQDGKQPLGESPLVEQLAVSLRRAGRALRVWRDPRVERRIAPTPIAPSAPSAAPLLPRRISASAVEALRDCPYRFFAKVMLRLREADELERDLEKRDYGTWLHAVLHQFHLSRLKPEGVSLETARLIAVATACQSDAGLDDAEFLPFSTSFRALAPRYIEWLHDRDRQGLQWHVGEYERVVSPPEFDGVSLEGHIDRIDVLGNDGESGTELIDYKTGSVDALKRRVKEPLEDTQLAFYAAILPDTLKSPLRAAYLALDQNRGIEFIEHKDVMQSARILVSGLASEFARLRDGAGLPALGEGETCERCEMRGLCRRDHWAAGVDRQ